MFGFYLREFQEKFQLVYRLSQTAAGAGTGSIPGQSAKKCDSAILLSCRELKGLIYR